MEKRGICLIKDDKITQKEELSSKKECVIPLFISGKSVYLLVVYALKQ